MSEDFEVHPIGTAERLKQLEAEAANWRDNYILLANTVNPAEDTPALDAAKDLHSKIAALTSEVLYWCDRSDSLSRQIDVVKEAAWERVSYGKVDFTAEDFKNSMMFDHPRYSWAELQDLIKGIKR
jgi:hypothetical protein